MKKLMLAMAMAVLPLAACGSDGSQAAFEAEIADQAATIESLEEKIAESADQAATIESLEAEIAELDRRAAEQTEEIADQAATIESLEAAAEAELQAREADSSAWRASLEASIEAGLNEQWSGEYEQHDVSCPAVDLEGLTAGDEFACQADCQCTPFPTQNVNPSEIRVVYDGNRAASWQEVLSPGASGPASNNGAPASGTFAG